MPPLAPPPKLTANLDKPSWPGPTPPVFPLTQQPPSPRARPWREGGLGGGRSASPDCPASCVFPPREAGAPREGASASGGKDNCCPGIAGWGSVGRFPGRPKLSPPRSCRGGKFRVRPKLSPPKLSGGPCPTEVVRGGCPTEVVTPEVVRGGCPTEVVTPEVVTPEVVKGFVSDRSCQVTTSRGRGGI